MLFQDTCVYVFKRQIIYIYVGYSHQKVSLYRLTPVRVAITKKTRSKSIEDEVKETLVLGLGIAAATMENSVGVPEKD